MPDVKDESSPELVATLAAELHRAWPPFASETFTEDAGGGLEPLALLQRVRHIAAALSRTLPASFEEAAAVLDRAIDSPSFTGWMTLPCGFYVADAGIADPHVALPLLGRLDPAWRCSNSATSPRPCSSCARPNC